MVGWFVGNQFLGSGPVGDDDLCYHRIGEFSPFLSYPFLFLFLFYVPSPASSEALTAVCKAFPVGSKDFPAGSRAVPVGPKSLPAYSKALPPCFSQDSLNHF